MKEKSKEFITKNLKWIILFICLIGFLALAEDVFHKEIMKGDIIGYKIISTFLIADFTTPIAKFITNFGGAIFLIILTITLFILIKNKKIGLSIILNLVVITGLNQILKNILQRPRPTEYRLIEETGFSFPSGHSMVSMAFYGYLIYLIYKYVKNKDLKWISIVLLSILICSIGISRIYLGVHYTSDVLGGFLISLSYLIVYTLIVNRYFSEDFNSVDLNSSKSSLTDAKDGGDIATKQKFIENDKMKDRWRAYELQYAIQNPDDGLPTDLYKALVVANQKGLISATTRWDEAITRSEAVELLVTALQQDASMETFNYKLGNYDSGMDTTTESTGTVEESTDSTSTESKAEINENDSQTSEGEANEDNVEQTTSNSDSLDDIASAKSYTLSEQEKADLRALGATEEQINNVKSGQDFIDLVYKLVNGDSNSAGGSSSSSAGTDSSESFGDEVHDPSMENHLPVDDGSLHGRM